MKPMRIFKAVLVIAMLFLAAPAFASSITVDQITYNIGDLTLAQAANLRATVDMEFNTGTSLLTVTLTNASGLTTGGTASASNLLTGLGFNLPEGVTIIDTPSQDSRIVLGADSIILNYGNPPGPLPKTPGDGDTAQAATSIIQA